MAGIVIHHGQVSAVLLDYRWYMNCARVLRADVFCDNVMGKAVFSPLMKSINNCDNQVCRLTVRDPMVDVTLFARRKAGRMTITRVSFGKKTIYNGRKIAVSRHPDCVRLGSKIKGFLDGKTKDLSRLPVDLSASPAFSKKVLLAARRIPWGTTVSYGRLAAMAGNPAGVRAVASVMRNNPFPLIIPCHRVIKNDGSVGGFMGKSKGREVRLKYQLLTQEQLAAP
jgi:O-6-methylguanine DNA methyltransferase